MERHTDSTRHGSRLMRWSLILGIVIVMNLFFNYALSLAYPSPDYAAYFPPTQVVQNFGNQQDCVSAGGQWNAQVVPKSPDGQVQPQGYCDQNYTRQRQFDAAQKQYGRVVFIVLVIVGAASIVAGSLVANELLSLAFSWGGVLSLFIASVRYWSDASNILRVVILAVALGSLIWTAVKKFA